MRTTFFALMVAAAAAGIAGAPQTLYVVAPPAPTIVPASTRPAIVPINTTPATTRPVVALAIHNVAPTTRPVSATESPATRPVLALKPAAPPAPVVIDYTGPAIRTLAQTLRTGENPLIIKAASDALASLGCQSIPALTALLDDPDITVRLKVLEIAGQMSQTRPAVPLLIRALHDQSLSVRLTALHQLSTWKTAEAPAVTAAAEALDDPEPRIRREAEQYLDDLGEDAAPAAPLLARSLDSRGIHLLTSIGPRARAAMPALVSFYGNKSNSTADRVSAVAAMARILTPAEPTTQPVLSSAH
jgi:HEAT repeat protein